MTKNMLREFFRLVTGCTSNFNHTGNSVAKRKFHKLSPRYYGPYQVEEGIGSVAYKLKLPTVAKIHHVFNESLLKKKVGDFVVVSAHLPPYVDPYSPRWYLAAILGRRMF